jgi:hypothetical protein
MTWILISGPELWVVGEASRCLDLGCPPVVKATVVMRRISFVVRSAQERLARILFWVLYGFSGRMPTRRYGVICLLCGALKRGSR